MQIEEEKEKTVYTGILFDGYKENRASVIFIWDEHTEPNLLL